MSRRLRSLICGACMTMALVALGLGLGLGAMLVTTTPVLASADQDNPPSGGGYGCKSAGNCNGTLYKDKSNLDKWWYEKCSGCHVVQAPPPPDVERALTRYQQDLVANKQRFWAFHADAETDPVLRRLTPKTRMVPERNVRSPYRELLHR